MKSTILSAQRTIFIVAGEASGDEHGAKLVIEAKKIAPQIHFIGIGGSAMRQAGVEIITDISQLSVMGITEVLLRYRQLKRILLQTSERLLQVNPDLLLTIDYPGFNFRLAKMAKQADIAVLHYIGPQIWAWRKGRLQKIRHIVDHFALLFPFEIRYYSELGIAATVVGHPLVDSVPLPIAVTAAKRQLGIAATTTTIGLFPGSRISEISRHMPLLTASAEQLLSSHPQCHFLLPVASTIAVEQIESYIPETLQQHITLSRQDTYRVINGCDVVIAASGTVNVEIALLQTPLVVIYKMSAISYAILSRLITIPYISLVNIIANRELAVELIQQRASMANVVTEVEKLLPASVQQQKRLELAQIRTLLGERGASSKVARLAIQLAERKADQ